jgi:hypothetical protein
LGGDTGSHPWLLVIWQGVAICPTALRREPSLSFGTANYQKLYETPICVNRRICWSTGISILHPSGIASRSGLEFRVLLLRLFGTRYSPNDCRSLGIPGVPCAPCGPQGHILEVVSPFRRHVFSSSRDYLALLRQRKKGPVVSVGLLRSTASHSYGSDSRSCLPGNFRQPLPPTSSPSLFDCSRLLGCV